MNTISVEIDGAQFAAGEVQISLLMQARDELATTSPIVVHIAPIGPEVAQEFWDEQRNADYKEIKFREARFTSILHGDDVVTMVMRDLTLYGVNENSFITLTAKSVEMLTHDSNHNQ